MIKEFKIFELFQDENIIEKIKKYLILNSGCNNWEEFVDDQSVGDCQGIVSSIISEFPDTKKVFGEIEVDPYVDEDGEEQSLMTHHWVLINNEIYDFSKGTLKYHMDFDKGEIYEPEVVDDWIYKPIMNEGMYSTAPTKKAVKILKRKFPDFYIGILQDGKIEISAGRKNYVDDVVSIEQICKPLGWFISHGIENGSDFKYGNEEFYEHEYDEIILKPLFDPKEFFSRPSILYHISPKRSLDKIFKIGLVPKHRDKKTYHPARIYLTDELELAWGLKKQFQRISGFEYEILKINMKDLKIKLYSDIDSRTYGYYTMENIPPRFISILPKEEHRKHWESIKNSST